MFLLIVESDFYLLLHLFMDFYKLEFGTFSHGCLPIVFTYERGPGGGGGNTIRYTRCPKNGFSWSFKFE